MARTLCLTRSLSSAPPKVMAGYTEVPLNEEKPFRMVVFFDGQNVLHTANDVFGLGRKPWNYDPRKLAEATREPIESYLQGRATPARVVVDQIRFYTGVPTYDRDLYGRSLWDRLFNRFRNDGIVVTERDLRYYTQGPPREKGIDLRIGLDLVRIATGGTCDAVVLFSQDTDLREAVIEARARLRYAGRAMFYFCAFPRSADPATHHGIADMQWIPLYPEAFEAAAYVEPPKVDIDALIGSLERRHRKRALRDFDLMNEGKRVTGCLRGCHKVTDDTAVLIVEATKSYLFVMNVHPEGAELYGKYKDMDVAVIGKGGHKGRLELEVRPLT